MASNETDAPLATTSRPGLSTRLRAWRARIVARPGFRRAVLRLPFLSSFSNRQAASLFSLTTGFVQSQVLFASLETGLLDALRAGPVTIATLAQRCDFTPDRMARLVQAADALRLVRSGADGFVALGDHGAVVASDPGIRAMVRHHGMLYRDLADPVGLFSGARTDTEMRRLWSYAGSDRAPVDAADADAYSALMAASQSMLSDEILDAYPFDRHRRVLDIGGGEGAFLLAMAARHPALDLALFDLVPVADRARARFASLPLKSSPRAHGGSFLSDPLPAGYDCMTLVRVLFDHEDAVVARLLATIRKAMPTGGRLVIAEPMAGKSDGQRLSTAYFGVYTLAMGSGRCRSPEDIGALALAAGFRRFSVRSCRTEMLATLVVAED